MAISQEELLFSLVQGEDGRIWSSSRKGWNMTERPPGTSGLVVPAGYIADASTVHVCCWKGVTCGDDGSTVTGIDIAGSDFVGTIPDALGRLTTLESINLQRNVVHGTIPRAVADLPNLETIDVSENHIVGTLPVFSSKGLLRLIASDNGLTGSIPHDLGHGHDRLLDVDISRNQLTGIVPESIGSLTNLNKLSLSENHFYGYIPENRGFFKSLQLLYLDGNKFVGTIPRSLTPMDSPLKEVWLQNNMLSGTVPSAFAEMGNLSNLYIDGNKLTGQLPRDLCEREINDDFFDEGRVDRSQGEYCSSIACPVGAVSPEGVFPCDPCDPGTYSPYLGREGSCINRDAKQILKTFWLETDGDRWTGTNNWFFDGVDHCDFTGVTCDEEGAVTSIVLKNMGLQGSIIEDVGFLEHLRRLDLSDNHLFGYVPSDLRFAPLDELDLSGNRLVGMVPPMLCLVGNVNRNGAGGRYDCDRIICPAGTYSPTGRAGDGNSCQRCDDGSEFAGRKSCGSSYGTSGGVDDGMSKTGLSLLVVFTVVILSAVIFYNRRKGSGTNVADVVDLTSYNDIDDEGERMPPPSDETSPDSIEVALHEMDDDLSSVTRVRRKKAKRRSKKRENYGQATSGDEEHGASSQQYNRVGTEDEEDRGPLWVDVAKLESVAETANEPNQLA